MKIEDLSQLGGLIKERRQLAGLTLDQASELLGVGRRFLIELEKGSRRANVETVIHVLKMYGLDLEVADSHRVYSPSSEIQRPPLRVFLGSTEVGVLQAGVTELEFSYVPDALDDPAVPQLSFSLPKATGSFKGTACSFFENLLPEGSQRKRLSEEVGVMEEDVYGILGAAVDCAGAVSLRPPGKAGHAAGYRSVSSRKFEKLFQSYDGSFARYQADSMSVLSGTRPKLAVVKKEGGWLLPEAGSPSTYFLKGPAWNLGNLDIVENEYFCMRLAAAIDLPAAEVEFLRLPGPVLLVKRFDREVGPNGDVRRIHQEDFCQATGTPSTSKFESQGGPGYARIAEILGRLSNLPVRDLSVMARWLVLNYLIDNRAGHGKNISILYSDQNVGLAPFYGLVSTAAMPDNVQDGTMTLAGETRTSMMTRHTWARVADELGLPEKAVLRARDDVIESAAAVLDDVVASATEVCGENPVFEKIADGVRERTTAPNRR